MVPMILSFKLQIILILFCPAIHVLVYNYRNAMAFKY